MTETNAVVPVNDLLNQIAALAPGELDEDTLAVAGSGNNNKRISIKGGVFRKIVAGKEVGSIEDRHMNIVFVKMAHTPSRGYYEQGYVEGAKVSPICWSTDAKVPDHEVRKKQAPSCDKCPWSVKGTGQNGQGTACRLSWRTAVVLPSDPSGDVMQLVLPAASVFGDEDSGRWPFRAYIQMLANRNVAAGRVVTKMSFDTKAPAPRVLFAPTAAVPVEDLATIKEQGTTLAAENAVKMTVFQRDEEVVEDAPEVAAVFAQVASVEATASSGGFVAATVAEAVPEPTLRETPKAAAAAPEKDVSAVIAKWAKK